MGKSGGNSKKLSLTAVAKSYSRNDLDSSDGEESEAEQSFTQVYAKALAEAHAEAEADGLFDQSLFSSGLNSSKEISSKEVTNEKTSSSQSPQTSYRTQETSGGSTETSSITMDTTILSEEKQEQIRRMKVDYYTQKAEKQLQLMQQTISEHEQLKDREESKKQDDRRKMFSDMKNPVPGVTMPNISELTFDLTSEDLNTDARQRRRIPHLLGVEEEISVTDNAINSETKEAKQAQYTSERVQPKIASITEGEELHQKMKNNEIDKIDVGSQDLKLSEHSRNQNKGHSQALLEGWNSHDDDDDEGSGLYLGWGSKSNSDSFDKEAQNSTKDSESMKDSKKSEQSTIDSSKKREYSNPPSTGSSIEGRSYNSKNQSPTSQSHDQRNTGTLITEMIAGNEELQKSERSDTTDPRRPSFGTMSLTFSQSDVEPNNQSQISTNTGRDSLRGSDYISAVSTQSSHPPLPPRAENHRTTQDYQQEHNDNVFQSDPNRLIFGNPVTSSSPFDVLDLDQQNMNKSQENESPFQEVSENTQDIRQEPQMTNNERITKIQARPPTFPSTHKLETEDKSTGLLPVKGKRTEELFLNEDSRADPFSNIESVRSITPTPFEDGSHNSSPKKRDSSSFSQKSQSMSIDNNSYSSHGSGNLGLNSNANVSLLSVMCD